MRKIKFVFCIHNHQPIGNFDFVYDRAYNEAYNPFMQVMLSHPQIKWCLHSSGMLWEYFTKERPEYVKSIKYLINIGSLEILSGGYCEPILPSIPDCDKIGQIKKMNSYLMNKFNFSEINGMWLAERVWEPALAMPISKCGIKYAVLDDMGFSLSGMDIESLDGYYVTEEQGYALNIFPISQKLRYLIPYCSPQECIDYFRRESAKENGVSVAVFADDGEKFGLWAGSNKLVYKERWLDSFLTLLEQNQDIVETATFSEILKSQPPSGKVYLPCSSYFEMTKWVLPSAMREKFETVAEKHQREYGNLQFIHGGFWRGFLSKYEEAGAMHKKMLHISRKISALIDNQKPFAEEALEYLYAGQCNCAYWHGSFGGLYFPHLRNAIYSKLIKAEGIYNETHISTGQWIEKDIDCDNVKEFLYEHNIQNIYVMRRGGSIYEWDIFRVSRNLTDTLTRRYESYHDILKNNLNNLISLDQIENDDILDPCKIKVRRYGLEKYLVYDKYQRTSLLDHFFDPQIKQEDFAFVNYEEKGDFIWGYYDGAIKGNKIVLSRKGKVCGEDFLVSKTITPKNGGYSAEYSVKNMSDKKIEICFGSEQVFSFASLDGGDSADLENAFSWARYDKYSAIGAEVKSSKPCRIIACPIETVVYSEGVFEKIYQGTSVVFLFSISLEPNETLEFSLDTALQYKKI
ncbi:MAG: DUF1926 domain-containing protein [Elusimicrobiota bacterium]|nr:DUF1926 domain-containing protein [Elusimicrobiota bacterium]